MNKLLAIWNILRGTAVEPPQPKARVLIIRPGAPEAWKKSHREALEHFLRSEAGALLCSHARWRHLNAASRAAQSRAPLDQDQAAGTADTLALLLSYSGLKELPDLLPDPTPRNEEEASETESLHTLLTHAPHDDDN